MTVSSITGRRQGPWLRGAIRLAVALAMGGLVIPDPIGTIAAGSAVAIVTLTPLARVVWIVFRLAQERDRQFVLVGVALLSVIAFGVLATLFLR